jgi:hypothetical protein
MHINCGWVTAFQWGIVACGVLAASLWFKASLIRIPPMTYAEVDNVVLALRRQSRMNAFAAAFTALAVLFQVLLIYAPTCVNLGWQF